MNALNTPLSLAPELRDYPFLEAQVTAVEHDDLITRTQMTSERLIDGVVAVEVRSLRPEIKKAMIINGLCALATGLIALLALATLALSLLSLPFALPLTPLLVVITFTCAVAALLLCREYKNIFLKNRALVGREKFAEDQKRGAKYWRQALASSVQDARRALLGSEPSYLEVKGSILLNKREKANYFLDWVDDLLESGTLDLSQACDEANLLSGIDKPLCIQEGSDEGPTFTFIDIEEERNLQELYLKAVSEELARSYSLDSLS